MKNKLRRIGIFIFWTVVWVCCVSLAYASELPREKLHARCASWSYLITNNLEDESTVKHLKETKGKLTLDQYMHELGYAEGVAKGISFSLRLPLDRVANDLYNKHCLTQYISEEM